MYVRYAMLGMFTPDLGTDNLLSILSHALLVIDENEGVHLVLSNRY